MFFSLCLGFANIIFKFNYKVKINKLIMEVLNTERNSRKRTTGTNEENKNETSANHPKAAQVEESSFTDIKPTTHEVSN